MFPMSSDAHLSKNRKVSPKKRQSIFYTGTIGVSLLLVTYLPTDFSLYILDFVLFPRDKQEGGGRLLCPWVNPFQTIKEAFGFS